MSKVVVIDVKKASILKALKDEVEGKIVHIAVQSDLEKLDAETLVKLHNGLVDEEDHIAEDADHDFASDELFELLEDNFDDLAVELEAPEPRATKTKGGKKKTKTSGEGGGRGRKPGSGAYIRQRLLAIGIEKKHREKILEEVKEKFPEGKTTMSDINWNVGKLRRDGDLPPPEKKAAAPKKADKKPVAKKSSKKK